MFKWNFMKACCTSMWSYFPQYIYSVSEHNYLQYSDFDFILKAENTN